MSEPVFKIDTLTADGDELALNYKVRRLPYLRSSEIQQRGLTALEDAGVLRTIADALGTATRALKLTIPQVDDKANEGGKAAALLRAWLSGQDMSAIIDALRDIVADHIMPAALTLPVVTRAICDAAVDVLDNQTNYKAHRRALNLADPEKRRNFYVKSEDLRDYLRESIRLDQAIDVVIEWLKVEQSREALGKLLPLASLAMRKGEQEAEKPKS